MVMVLIYLPNRFKFVVYLEISNKKDSSMEWKREIQKNRVETVR